MKHKVWAFLLLAAAGVAVAAHAQSAPAPSADTSASDDTEAAPADSFDTAVKNRPCLDYWVVGDAKGCAPPAKKTKKPTPKPPSPTVVATPAADPSETKLDKKIDEFLANHGKPPREFVAFYLDPTPEHAVEWVAKYNELLKRGQDIAVAWTQAETLYNNALKQGVSESALNPHAFAPVPDFGIPVPGFNTPAYTQLSANNTMPAVIPSPLSNFSNQGSRLGTIDPAMLAITPPPVIAPSSTGGLLKPVDGSIIPDKPIEVSYYFSAICPYCKRFGPGFSQLMSDKDVASHVKLTCVDVTPEISGKERSADDLSDKLPCLWRPATDEELSKLGIKQTPSLIINRGDNKPLELVSGYVEPSTLKSYFLSKGQ